MHADVSVRPAIESDAPQITAVQVAAWQRNYPPLPTEISGLIDEGEFTASWQAAIATPPTPQHQMFTALTGPTIVGFAALAPVNDNTGQITALEVSPDHLRQGHGSRLLAACVDSLRIAGAENIRIWVLETDEVRQQFIASAGFGPMGRRRSLEGGITEIAFTASIQDG